MLFDHQLIEQTEAAAWKDLFDAAPPAFKAERGMRYEQIDSGLAINFKTLPIPLFNRIIGAGTREPLMQETIDTVRQFYTCNEKYLVHFLAGVQTNAAQDLLLENGFVISGKWDRVVRDGRPLAVEPERNFEVLLVDTGTAQLWSTFLCDCYGFDFYEWPQALARREGWRNYIAKRAGRIVACRSFFITEEKTVFSGVDAPVPGVMTGDCSADFAIWRTAIRDGLALGAKLFVADIEQPDRTKNSDAYKGFKALNFEIPYTRVHFTPCQC